jgi:multiple sugar transport system permease protein
MLAELQPREAGPVTLPPPARPAWFRPAWSRRAVGGLAPYLYLVPALAGLVVWIYRPLVETFDYSFYNWNMLPTSPMIPAGWHNYSQLFHLPALWQALGTTGLYMAGLIVFGVGLPLLIGVMGQNVPARSRGVYRALIFMPVLISPVVAATVWQFLLTPNGGLVDTVLHWFGLAQTNWLQQPNTAKFAIVAISGWKLLGVSVLVLTAGLAAISPEYSEAAAIEGAGRFQVFRRITLPLLSPTLMFMFITAVLVSSQVVFPLINVLTQGGPEGSSTDIYYFLYQYGFTSFNVGLASAAAVCFFLTFGVLALICAWLLERFSFYDN